jgi:NTP pyrophosphatase (non-canonical NTP hydrolase)
MKLDENYKSRPNLNYEVKGLTLKAFQILSSRTIPEREKRDLLINFLFGLVGESGELVDLFKKIIFHGHKLDEDMRKKIIKESGDVLWYLSAILEVMGLSLEDVGYENIKKLNERYKFGFTETESINRKEEK